MKKILCFLLSVLMLSYILTGCELNVARPEIKEGRFNISVTYEHDGNVKTLSGVYVCEYDGVVWWSINGDPYVDWKTHLEGDLNAESIPVCTTDDGGEIFITMLLYPEYFMGDPKYTDFTPIVTAEILYEDHQIDDAQTVAEYGVRLIGYEYDEPIKNTYK